MNNSKRTNLVWIHSNSDRPTFHQINNNTTPNQNKTGDADYKNNALQGLLQEGLFTKLLQGLPSLWIQAKNQSQHCEGKNNFGFLWYKNTNTYKDIEKKWHRKTK
jgi:hypothetical protein